jgi:hypothetical protein
MAEPFPRDLQNPPALTRGRRFLKGKFPKEFIRFGVQAAEAGTKLPVALPRTPNKRGKALEHTQKNRESFGDVKGHTP